MTEPMYPDEFDRLPLDLSQAERDATAYRLQYAIYEQQQTMMGQLGQMLDEQRALHVAILAALDPERAAAKQPDSWSESGMQSLGKT